jgi:hypothetical protein
MTWDQFYLARLLMAEERIGRPMREHDRAQLDEEQRGQAILRARGLVD